MVQDRASGENSQETRRANSKESPLQSWKEIAAYLNRDVRTAQRWEKTAGLPVRRHRNGPGSSVYAYPNELDTWRAAQEPKATEPPRDPFLSRWSVPAVIGLLLIAAAVWFVKIGPILNPPNSLVEAEGVTIRQVWAGPGVDPEAAVSPDGRYLSFVGGTGDLTLRDLAAETNRRLTNQGDWLQFALYSVFSPDSKTIAYAWFKGDSSYDLRLIGIDGSAPRILYHDDAVEFVKPIGWSPDGKQILVSLYRTDETNQIALVSVADGSLQVFKTLAHGPKAQVRFWRGLNLSPDGRYIVFDFPTDQEDRNRDIFLLSTETKHEIPLVQHVANDQRPIWTPDGRHIVFLSDRTGTWCVWRQRVENGMPEGSPTLVRRDFGRNLPMGFTQEGEFYYGLGTKMYEIYTVGIDLTAGRVLGEPTQVSQRFAGTNRYPDWSPDGDFLSYVSWRRPAPAYGSRIVIRPLASGAEREITPELPFFGAPRWSRDGNSFLTGGRDDEGRRGLFRIHPKTGEVTMVLAKAPTPPVLEGIVSRDGEVVYYVVQNDAETVQTLKVHNRNTDEKTQLFEAYAPWSLNLLSLSRDEQLLAFRLANFETGAKSLQVIPTEGGKAVNLLQVQTPETLPFQRDRYDWAPDDKEILFVRAIGDPLDMGRQEGELVGISIEGGALRKYGLAMDRLGYLRLHPEGRLLAFQSGPYHGEVWVMEGFLPEQSASD